MCWLAEWAPLLLCEAGCSTLYKPTVLVLLDHMDHGVEGSTSRSSNGNDVPKIIGHYDINKKPIHILGVPVYT